MISVLLVSVLSLAAPVEPSCMMDMEEFTTKEIVKVSTGEVWKLTKDTSEFYGEVLADLEGNPIREKIQHKESGFEANSIYGTTVTLRNNKTKKVLSTIVCLPPPKR